MAAHEGDSKAADDQGTPLLDLPAELRNYIYELAVISPQIVQVTGSTRPPALLHTCRQIRREARAIWLHGNRFRHDISNCDISFYLKFRRQFSIKRPAGSKGRQTVRYSGDVNWSNLLRGCKFVQEGNISEQMQTPTYMSATGKVVCGAMQIAQRFKGKNWQECEEILKSYRIGIDALEPKWMED